MTDRLGHFPRVAVISLMDVVDAVCHALSAVETVILSDDLELPDLGGEQFCGRGIYVKSLIHSVFPYGWNEGLSRRSLRAECTPDEIPSVL